MAVANRVSKVVWMKKHWGYKQNPFPAEGIARLGGEDPRENGSLFNEHVQPEKLAEAAEKFVLGAAYSGLKFGYLWSLATTINADARGFGKSVVMNHLAEKINTDFGRTILLECGLDESDADDKAICAVLSSFDMANIRSLNAVFYEAARYACRFRNHPGSPTLVERVRERLVQRVGTDKTKALVLAVEDVQANLRGRTLGPPVDEFLELICGSDLKRLQQHIDGVTPAKRTRSGATYLSTLLLMIKAAGIDHVLLCCDQLEDFASTTTTRQKRSIETERFRDYILELQPMSDMLSCVVTLHPRATLAIGEMWRLADLPSYEFDRAENQHRIVLLEPVKSIDKAAELMKPYLDASRTSANGGTPSDPLLPFTREAIEEIFTRSDGKPRYILRKAHKVWETGAEENWDVIRAEAAARVLDSLVEGDAETDAAVPAAIKTPADLWSA